MQSDFKEVDKLVSQIKGNTSFLRKLIFSRVNAVAIALVSALFLIAALTIK